ncbi:hypothetical protein KM043_012309 [Ampulex compressa]|nr:hypothetical protein KM043_012309 [Ampulex compressa]
MIGHRSGPPGPPGKGREIPEVSPRGSRFWPRPRALAGAGRSTEMIHRSNGIYRPLALDNVSESFISSTDGESREGYAEVTRTLRGSPPGGARRARDRLAALTSRSADRLPRREGSFGTIEKILVSTGSVDSAGRKDDEWKPFSFGERRAAVTSASSASCL